MKPRNVVMHTDDVDGISMSGLTSAVNMVKDILLTPTSKSSTGVSTVSIGFNLLHIYVYINHIITPKVWKKV